MSRERRYGGLLLALIVLWSVSPLLYYAFATYDLPADRGRYFKIPTGSTLREISFALRDQGIIEHPYVFMSLVYLRGGETRLHAGTYRFEDRMSMMKIVDDLTQGRVADIPITIPEGLAFPDIAEIVSRTIGQERSEVDGLVRDPELLSLLDSEAPSLEGFLFPDTYAVPIDIEAKEIFRLMIKRYREVFDDNLRRRAQELGFSEVEIVTLASIIEKETRLKSERRLISGVFHKRLRKGIPLEADPTVRYALGKTTGPLVYKDLEVDSPYNTYRRGGLPPGPICSPGKASLIAALYPEEADHLYFVATGEGNHVFSATLEEHNLAKQKVRKFD